ncbi:Receptor-like protein, partial [Drosera capensis]
MQNAIRFGLCLPENERFPIQAHMASLVTYLVVFVEFYLLAVPSLSCPHYQKEALLEFKGLVVRELKQHKNWSSHVLMSWNSSSNCCEWERVTCNSRVVTDLRLSFFIPLPVSVKILPPLFRVSTLRYLDISENSIQGQIPSPGFGNLTKLTYLDMRANVNLNGSIPQDLYLLRDLQHLDLSANDFAGSLSSAFGGLRNLKYLNLLENNVHGRIPEGIGNMTELTVLSLHDNLFSGGIPSSFRSGNLTNLVYLDMSRNKLDGSIPREFFGPLRSLKYIDLSFNNLSGELPRNIEGAVNMDTLVSNLHALRILDLSKNGLTGEIPHSLSLTILSNVVEASVTPLLVVGDLDGVGCSDSLGCRVSRRIDVSSYVRDLIVNWKRSKHYLSTEDFALYSLLDLSDNRLSGPIPTSLGDSQILKSLNLSHNRLSSYIPSSLGNLESLEVLDLSHNALSGVIPWTLAKLQQLNTIDLSNNQLVGRIPDSPQLDSLIDPRFYANNSGICGLQIQVPCQTPSPPWAQTEATEKSESKDAIFSWEIAGIVFPISFVGTVAVMYSSGYFHSGGKVKKSALRGGSSAPLLHQLKESETKPVIKLRQSKIEAPPAWFIRGAFVFGFGWNKAFELRLITVAKIPANFSVSLSRRLI